MQKYFYHYQGNSFGPYSKEEIIKLNLPTETQIWDSQLEVWEKIENIPDLYLIVSNDIIEKPLTYSDWFKYLSTGKNSYLIISKLKKYNLSFWIMLGLMLAISVYLVITYQHIMERNFNWNFIEFLSLIGAAGVSFVFRTAIFVASLICIISLLEIVYLTWKILEFENPSITASRVIGYLFIPFYNIWWAYYIIIQTNEEIEKFAKKRNIKTIHQISPKLVFSTAILAMLFFIPIIGFVVLIPFLILQFMFMQKLTENTIELYRYVERNRPK